MPAVPEPLRSASLAFGADGALYVSAGDGASFNFADYGQDGTPVNPCGDPPGGVGGSMTPPTAEGGALRSQDVRTTGRPDEPRRLDPARRTPTPAPRMPGNPNAAARIPNARRIVAYGLRNPFRITVRPGTNEVWAGDVGWNAWEEINRVADPDRRGAQLRLALLRGHRPHGRLRQPQPQHLRDLYAQGTRRPRRAVLHVQPLARAWSPARPAATGALVDLRPRLLPAGRQLPGRVRGRAVLLRLQPRLHLGDARGQPTACPTRRNRPDVRRRRRQPGRARSSARAATSTTSTSTAARSGASAALVTNRTPIAARHRDARRRARCRSPSTFDGSTLERPRRRRRSTYAWDLDGDGAVRRLDRRPRRASRTPRRHLHRAPARHRPGRPDGHRQRPDHRRHRRRSRSSPSPRPPPARPGRSTTRSPSAARRPTSSGNADRAAAGLTLGHQPPALRPRERLLPHAPAADVRRRRRRLVRGARPRVPVVPRDRAHGDATPTASRGTATRRLDPRTVQLTLASQPAGVQLTLGGETVTAPFTREVIQGSHQRHRRRDAADHRRPRPTRSPRWSNARRAQPHDGGQRRPRRSPATFERSTALEARAAPT